MHNSGVCENLMFAFGAPAMTISILNFRVIAISLNYHATARGTIGIGKIGTPNYISDVNMPEMLLCHLIINIPAADQHVFKRIFFCHFTQNEHIFVPHYRLVVCVCQADVSFKFGQFMDNLCGLVFAILRKYRMMRLGNIVIMTEITTHIATK